MAKMPPPLTPKENKEDRIKALEAAVAQIEKAYGKGSIMKLGSAVGLVKVAVIPTQRIVVDDLTGVGGLPKGRIIEIFGPEASGKTTLALHAVASSQSTGGTAAFIDAEHALDSHYAGRLGVNMDDLLISQPDTGEQALEIAEILVRSGAVDIIVVDSVAALVPEAEIKGEMGDAHVGLQARLMSQALRKLTSAIHRSNTCVVFINQIRAKIGPSYGSNETTTGGRALKFYSSMRIDIRRGMPLRDSNNATYGHKTKIKIVKNKLAPPFRDAEVEMLFGEGISREGMAIDLGIEYKLLTRTGSWFSYGEMRLGQGRENVRRLLKENNELLEEIETQVKNLMTSENRPAKTKVASDDKEPEQADDWEESSED
jgi:recombination protein RecA